MTMKNNGVNNLHGLAQFALFVSSYLPLFILITARQISENYEFLNWAGFSLVGFQFFILKFGLSSILVFASVIGLFGYRQTIGNVEEVAKNGNPVTIRDVKNKNSEAIGYIATYIIPFLYQSYDGLYECCSILFLMAIIYRLAISRNKYLQDDANIKIYEIGHKLYFATNNN